MMTEFLLECALLVIMFYKNKRNASTTVREFRSLKNLPRYRMSTKVSGPRLKDLKRRKN